MSAIGGEVLRSFEVLGGQSISFYVKAIQELLVELHELTKRNRSWQAWKLDVPRNYSTLGKPGYWLWLKTLRMVCLSLTDEEGKLLWVLCSLWLYTVIHGASHNAAA